MEVEKLEWRDVFNRQPVYFLFVDVSSPMDFDSLNKLCIILNDITALAVSLKGSLRFSVLGIYLMGGYVECVFPMQPVKQNFTKLQSSLENMKSLFCDITSTGVCSQDNLIKAVSDVFDQYEKYFQGSFLTKEEWPQLQLILLSSQPLKIISRLIQNILPHFNLTCVRKIQVVGVQCSQHAAWNSPSPESENSSNSSPVLLVTEDSCNSDIELAKGIVEVNALENNIYCLEGFFKEWLHDWTTDSDHLRIVFCRDQEAEPLILKCDLHECVINPEILPVSSQFCLSSDAGFSQLVMPNQAKQVNGKLPVYYLEAVGVVKQAGICESTIFGHPFIVCCTHCWKINWDELEANQHVFNAINYYLKEQNLVLIAKRQSQVASNEHLPQGMFVIFPSKNSTMLIKSIAVKELLLPNVMNTQIDQSGVPEEIKTKAKGYLETLEVFTQYNPLQVSSGLYPHLATTLKQKKIPRNLKPPTGSTAVKVKSNMSFVFSKDTKRKKSSSDAEEINPRGSKSNCPFGSDFMKASYLLKKFPTKL